MAYVPHELFDSGSQEGTLRVIPEHILPKTFAVVLAETTLPKLTPLTYDSVGGTGWIVWTAAAAIDGFVWPEDAVLSTTGEVIWNVLMAGTIHRDDIPVPDGEIQADLDTALRVGLRAKGFHIQGLDDVR